jgi:leucyl aminopeptidase
MAPIQEKDLFVLPEAPAITSVGTKASAWAGDVLFIGLKEGSFEGNTLSAECKKALEGFSEGALNTISEILSDDEFKLKPGSSKVFSTCGASTSKHICLVGLGALDETSKKWGKSAWHGLGTAMKSVTKTNKCKTAALVTPGVTSPVVEDIGNGLFLGSYESTRFKSDQKGNGNGVLTSLEILGSTVEGLEKKVSDSMALAKGITVCRYLVEAPPNVASPEHLAECAQMIKDTYPDLFELTVFGRKECEDMGMGCYLGVAEAADTEPQFIHLKYKGPGTTESSPKIGLVGKGVTFDSGGYNLKAGAGSMIEMMKFDMGGSGAVLGSAYAVGGMKPGNVEVNFIVAACENMINGHGCRPGDVLTASNGKTVEINNTDAEGRLTLCDAIIYAGKQGCGTIVDIATLTGACMVALGMDIAGLYSNTDELAADLKSSGGTHGEKLWRMPLEDDYKELLKSPVADMKNTGIRWGGSITAALYLKEFVPENTSWAHIDMAGPVWDDKKGGATGFGVSTLAQYVMSQSK